MHRDQPLHYLGSAGESITINSSAPSSGTLQVSSSTEPVLPALPQGAVNFSATAGEERDLVATLTGAPGSHCALSVATVDGGKDVVILNVGDGAFHDSVLLEFVTGSTATQNFVANALTQPQGRRRREVREKIVLTVIALVSSAGAHGQTQPASPTTSASTLVDTCAQVVDNITDKARQGIQAESFRTRRLLATSLVAPLSLAKHNQLPQVHVESHWILGSECGL